MLTPRQLRAARALVGYSREKLAKASGTSAEAIKNYETRGADSRGSTLIAWRTALIKAGVIFLDADDEAEEGVRYRGVKGSRGRG
jgi:transcriptional regulator with XRE-family HTH domain